MDDQVLLEHTMKNNKFVFQDASDTPCVLCGSSSRIRIGNTLLETGNPQCVNTTECLKERNIFSLCKVCGSRERVELVENWQDLVERQAIPIVGCGNPWHYVGLYRRKK